MAEASTPDVSLSQDPEAGYTGREGDTRGHYGYGRPAHGSDPSAQYVFGERPQLQS